MRNENKFIKRPRGSQPPDVHNNPVRTFLNVSLEYYAGEMIHSYQVACIVTMCLETTWLIWVIVATALYGSKAIFAWLMFFGIAVRIMLLLYCASKEEYPERIGSTIFSDPPDLLRAEQWFRWFGIKGIGHPHGYYSLFSQWVHPVIILVLVVIQISTRQNFSTDRFWLINCAVAVAYIFYSFLVNWHLVLRGCVIPRETCVALARSDII